MSSPTPHWELTQCTTTSLLSLIGDQLGSDVCRGLVEGEEGVLVKLVCLCVRASTLSEGFGHVISSVGELISRYSMVASDGWVPSILFQHTHITKRVVLFWPNFSHPCVECCTFCVIISISLCRAVLWLYDFLMKLLVWGESLNCSGGITLPKLDHKRPPEQTQLICLVAALINAAQKQVLSVHYRGLLPNMRCMCHTGGSMASWYPSYSVAGASLLLLSPGHLPTSCQGLCFHHQQNGRRLVFCWHIA